MFKKTKIAAATVALLGSVVAHNVSAVSFDESGSKAQVLIFPYYNVNNGFVSAINIRNTTGAYKVVKVRYRESKSSNDVLDVNVYLSPYDHWSASVNAGADGIAYLQTTDTSCTYPANVAATSPGVPGKETKFNSNVYVNTTDKDAFEGYIEVIEMGDLLQGFYPTKGQTTGTTVTQGIKHVASTNIPLDCSVISKAWNSSTGTFTEGGAYSRVAAANLDLEGNVTAFNGVGDTGGLGNTFYGASYPAGMTRGSGGIAGWTFLLSLKDGAAFVGDAAQIRNYSTRPQHYRTDSTHYLLPSLASGNVLSAVTYDVTGNAALKNTWRPVVADWTNSDPEVEFNAAVKAANPGFRPSGAGVNPFPISDVLAASGLNNDWLYAKNGTTSLVATDWVITLPMKKHGIWNGYRYDNVSSPKTGTVDPTIADKDWINLFSAEVEDYKVPEYTAIVYNREENSLTPEETEQVSPPITRRTIRQLEREVNVISFTPNSDDPSLLGSPYADPINVGTFNDGWAAISYTRGVGELYAHYNSSVAPYASWFDTAPAGADFTVAPVSYGLPTIGFGAIRGAIDATRNVGESTRHNIVRDRAAVTTP